MKVNIFSVPPAPEITPEWKETVDEVIEVLKSKNMSFHEVYAVLDVIKVEVEHRSRFLHL